jgi:hypothetical protein
MAFRITLQDHGFEAPHFPALIGADEARVRQLVTGFQERESVAPPSAEFKPGTGILS